MTKNPISLKQAGLDEEPELVFSMPGYEVFAVPSSDAGQAVDLTRRVRRYLNSRRPKSAPPFGVLVAVLGEAPAGQEGGPR